MSKFINKLTRNSLSSERQQPKQPSEEIATSHSGAGKFNNMKRSLSINTTSLNSTKTRTSTSSTSSENSNILKNQDSFSSLNARPIVKSPNWSIRYDPTLSVYYYVNDKTNETQFDHPDEVVSPTASPVLQNSDCSILGGSSYDTDHRKIFSTGLKRTFSPKFFTSSNSNNHNNGNKSKSASVSPRDSFENTIIPKTNSFNTSDQDEDVEEFRRQLELEMKSYECERLRSV